MGYVGVRFRPRGAHRRDLGPEPSNTARTGTTYGQVEPLAARPRGYPCSRRAGGRWPEGSGAHVGYATYPNNVPQRKQRGVGRFSNCLPRWVLIQSGRPDSNRRPPAPKAGALPDCATPRTTYECRRSVGQLKAFRLIFRRSTRHSDTEAIPRGFPLTSFPGSQIVSASRIIWTSVLILSRSNRSNQSRILTTAAATTSKRRTQRPAKP